MAHEQDDPSVNKLVTISVVGTLLAILVAFLGVAALNGYTNKIPTEYSQSSTSE